MGVERWTRLITSCSTKDLSEGKLRDGVFYGKHHVTSTTLLGPAKALQ